MNIKPTVPLLVSAVVVSILGVWCWHKKRTKVKHYIAVGTVKKLYFYPVKSLRGLEVDELHSTDIGLEYKGVIERAFMLIDDEGVLISQRQEPKLALLHTSIEEKVLTVWKLNTDILVVAIKDEVQAGEKVITCRLHGDRVEAVDCGDKAAEWFQKYLRRTDVRLVRHSSALATRKYQGIDPVLTKYAKDHPIAFQDFAALHLATESSLIELNNRIETSKVSVLNFRPNVFVEGSSPFDEDNWKYVKFSSGVEMFNFHPCGRCVLTTVDPETGIKTDKEPLVTLRKFRKCKDQVLSKRINYSPCFGIQCYFVQNGVIRVKDEVFAVIEKGLFQYIDKS